jgi:hypothetical protein
MKKILFVTSTLIALRAPCEVERIQSLRFDRGVAEKVYLAPGLGSVIQFPCALQEVFVGRSEDVRAQISPTDKRTLFLNLKLNASLPTNIIAKCEAQKNVFVFDVIPSKLRHQDVVEIRSSFGGPVQKSMGSPFSKSQDQALKKLVIKKPVLVSHGGSK